MNTESNTDNTDLLGKDQKYDENQMYIKNNQKTIKKRISDCLCDFGFRKKKDSLFTRFREDIVDYFVLEHPPGRFLCTYCIYPLFMPPMENLSLNIGKRLDYSSGNHKMIIHNDATGKDMDEWCALVSSFICKDIESFIQNVDTAEKMVRYLDGKEGTFPLANVVRISLLSQYELLMYASLFLHDYSKAREAAIGYLGEIDVPRYGMIVRNNGRSRYQHVTELAELADDQIVDCELKQWREKNIIFFKGQGTWRAIGDGSV